MTAFRIEFQDDLYYRFPWLEGSKLRLFQSIGIPTEILEKMPLEQVLMRIFREFPDLKDRLLVLFQNLVMAKERFDPPVDDITHLAMYPVMQILLQMLKNRILANAFANIFAKDTEEALDGTSGRKRYPDNMLVRIANNINIHIEEVHRNSIEGQIYPFIANFASYLSTAASYPDSHWKLVNKYLIDGNVQLTRHDIVMILREYVRKKVMPDLTPFPEPFIVALRTVPEIVEIENLVSDLIAMNAQRFQSSFLTDGEKVGSELFAPCIQMILKRVQMGENLSHNERLAIAFYFLNTNHSIEETVDIFRTSPDFDEGIARYQVEFAAGKGKGKKYSMFNCVKLKSLHLCYAEHPQIGDKLCVKGGRKSNGEMVKIVNPAYDFIFWKKVELNRLHKSQIRAMEQSVETQSDSNQEIPTK